ncbi:MAG: hypothetical protein ACM35G_02510 [Planctomycetaceae bacterium]
MKKAFIACLAVAALFALAGPASAITCTSDQHPAATLLVPYFQVSYDDAGNLISTGLGARDTIVTIVNASSAPMVAHVSVYTRESIFKLDFNVALTGFDVQAMRVSDILAGNLPSAGSTVGGGVCQHEGGGVYPDGFLRVIPPAPATGLDNSRAISDYPSPAFGPAFSSDLIAALRANCDGGEDPLAIGYILIDMANYCNLSDPSDPNYWQFNAAGMENNLMGEVIFTSGFGLPTYGMSTVNLEADQEFGFAAQSTTTPVRTFYARYWNAGDNSGITGTTTGGPTCPNCGSGDPTTDLNLSSPWNIGYGDMREPLGLRWGARWFDLVDTSSGLSILTANFQVWRGPYNGANCDVNGPTVVLTFFDEDENTITQGGCISPCSTITDNFPLETQQTNINAFGHPTAAAGWVSMNFANLSDGSVFDQAWVDYTFEGNIALESVLVPGTQLDPSACNPLGYDDPAVSDPIQPEVPTVPTGIGI